jgi:peptidoglycan/LPS O-acetylase OafA/YrhL
MSPRKETQYRPDIDVLRAVSILAVTLFHLKVPGFSGGFIGVDIFFVISGFLMTSIICNELTSTGKLDYLSFCERRMRRILPALLAIVLCVTLASLIVPLSTTESLRSQIISAAIFASNFYYWNAAGYFDSASTIKPLLHTWSLSVEAQFYVFWPLLLLLAGRRLPWSAMPIALVIVFLLSFVSGLFFTDTKSLPALFYMMPFRVFEFALGGLLYFDKVSLPLSKLALQVGIVCCIAAIAVCTHFYSDKMIFPAWNALVPCLAAAAYIALGKRTTFPSLFESRLLLAIGKLSYAIYLVHWPIIVFYLHLTDQDLGWVDIGALLALSTASALVLHYGVERRFYRPRSEPRWAPPIKFGVGASLATLTLTTFAFFAFAISTASTAGSAHSLDPVKIYRDGRNYTWDNHQKLDAPFDINSRRKIIVIGDSQAADVVNLLLAYNPSLSAEIRTFVSSAGCQIKFTDAYYHEREIANGSSDETIEHCKDDRARFHADRRLKEADTIVVAYSWRPAALGYMPEEIAKIEQKNPSASVYVAGTKKQPRSGIWFLEQRLTHRQAAAFARNHAVPNVLETNTTLASKFGQKFLDFYSVTCTESACQVFTDTGFPIFFDELHVTAIGAQHIARSIPFYRRIGEPLYLEPSQDYL